MSDMVEIVKVETKKQQREFLNFPLDMYKDNPYFVPPLYGDEKKIFSKNYVYNDTCEHVYFNAYRDGKMVGRISGILQRSSNEIRNEKRVRFTRFDSIDDQEVASALFKAVEDWARSKGMDTVCGPLGFSDLEREGLLIEGFDQLSTFEEQYNAEYYGRLIENCGYAKEVDWLESKIYRPVEPDESFAKMSDFIMKRYNLRFGEAKNVNDFIDRYGEDFFKLLDEGYSHLYGTVPFTKGMKDMMIANFKLILDLKYVGVILDENNKLVALGLCFPSMSKAIQKSRGHLTPAALVRLLKAIKRPTILDLGLICVSHEYMNRGVGSVITAELYRMLQDERIEYAETNLNLEDNHAIQNQWKRFKAVNHKRRRSYVKKLEG
ncbi:MAG: N-acetyltransferase [Oscillospiraceae bacterium]|nr:N-acetyltransferase [Oscillospiraceae bacterium]